MTEGVWYGGWQFAGEAGEVVAFWISLQVGVFGTLIVVRMAYSAVRLVSEWIVRLVASAA